MILRAWLLLACAALHAVVHAGSACFPCNVLLDVYTQTGRLAGMYGNVGAQCAFNYFAGNYAGTACTISCCCCLTCTALCVCRLWKVIPAGSCAWPHAAGGGRGGPVAWEGGLEALSTSNCHTDFIALVLSCSACSCPDKGTSASMPFTCVTLQHADFQRHHHVNINASPSACKSQPGLLLGPASSRLPSSPVCLSTVSPCGNILVAMA